jgi:hypothetical protein
MNGRRGHGPSPGLRLQPLVGGPRSRRPLAVRRGASRCRTGQATGSAVGTGGRHAGGRGLLVPTGRRRSLRSGAFGVAVLRARAGQPVVIAHALLTVLCAVLLHGVDTCRRRVLSVAGREWDKLRELLCGLFTPVRAPVDPTAATCTGWRTFAGPAPGAPRQVLLADTVARRGPPQSSLCRQGTGPSATFTTCPEPGAPCTVRSPHRPSDRW